MYGGALPGGVRGPYLIHAAGQEAINEPASTLKKGEGLCGSKASEDKGEETSSKDDRGKGEIRGLRARNT